MLPNQDRRTGVYTTLPEHLQVQQRDRILELYDNSHAYGVDHQIRFWEDKAARPPSKTFLAKIRKGVPTTGYGTLSFGYTDSHIWVKIPMVYKVPKRCQILV